MSNRSSVAPSSRKFNWRITAATINAASPGARVSCLESTITDAEIGTAKSYGCYDISYDYHHWRDGLDAKIHTQGMLVAVCTPWTAKRRQSTSERICMPTSSSPTTQGLRSAGDQLIAQRGVKISENHLPPSIRLADSISTTIMMVERTIE
ncbi:MAG: hypothetical protein ACR2P2_03955 [Nakamurella sp.]